jgi:hypothetical protein
MPRRRMSRRTMRRSRRQRGGFCSSPFSFTESCEQANARLAAAGPSKSWFSNPLASTTPVQQQQQQQEQEDPYGLNNAQTSSYNDAHETNQEMMNKQVAPQGSFGGRRRMRRGGSVRPFSGVYSSHALFKGGRRTRKSRKSRKSKKSKKSRK